MRMTENHLLAEAIHHISNVKLSPLLRNAGIKHNVKEHVSELLLNVAFRLLQDGVAQFVCLLECHRTERLHCLGGIPGTFFPQLAHHIQHPAELRQLFLIGMGHCNRAYVGNQSFLASAAAGSFFGAIPASLSNSPSVSILQAPLKRAPSSTASLLTCRSPATSQVSFRLRISLT